MKTSASRMPNDHPSPWDRERVAREPTWSSPLGAWKAFLVALFTFGLYPPFSIGTLARDRSDNCDDIVKPWLVTIGLCIPLVGLAVLYQQARRVAELLAASDLRPGRSPARIVGYAFFYSLGLTAFFASPLQGTVALPAVVAVCFFAGQSFSCLLVQEEANRFKRQLPPARLRGETNRLSSDHIGAIISGVIVMALIAFWPQAGRDFRLSISGDTLSSGQVVIGQSTLYDLTIPGEGWLRVANGAIHADTDLALYTPSKKAYAVVYVTPKGDWSLDETVRNRLSISEDELELQSFEEERRLLPDKLVPMSFAVYRGKSRKLDRAEFMKVTTIETERGTIELIAVAPERSQETDQLDRLIGSFRPDEKAFVKP